MKKINVIHIISNLSLGGAQILLLDILKNLKEKNEFNVSVISIDSGEYIGDYEKSGITVTDLKEKGLFNIKIYFKLKKLFRELKPDIVHTHLLKADFYGRLAAKQSDVPVIYSTCHNYSSHHKGADVNKKSIFDFIDNFVVTYSGSNLIAISEIVKTYLVNRNRNFDRITEVIYNGVDTKKEIYKLNPDEKTDLRKKLNIAEEEFVILIMGRLDIQKGHSFFMHSVKDFLKEKKNVKVLILGDGNLRNELQNQIDESQLMDYVKILGFRTETEKFVEISDLVCVPSLWEGFGLVIIEGMIKRKIVLAAETGGIPEIIEHGKNGFMFEVKNSKSLLGMINYIYDNIRDLDIIKENAVKTVKEKFNIKKNSEKYSESYLNKIKSNHQSRNNSDDDF